MMEETAIPSATLDSNMETESETPDGIISVSQQQKRRKEDRKGEQRFDTKQEWCTSWEDGGPFEGYLFSIDKLSITTGIRFG